MWRLVGCRLGTKQKESATQFSDVGTGGDIRAHHDLISHQSNSNLGLAAYHGDPKPGSLLALTPLPPPPDVQPSYQQSNAHRCASRDDDPNDRTCSHAVIRRPDLRAARDLARAIH